MLKQLCAFYACLILSLKWIVTVNISLSLPCRARIYLASTNNVFILVLFFFFQSRFVDHFEDEELIQVKRTGHKTYVLYFPLR